MSAKSAIAYPDSDGKPRADNTLQAFWIFVFYGNLLALYRAREDVFVAADTFWYPVEGELFRMAPAVHVVFGRPKGHRGSYKQWEEAGVPLAIVFEVLSPSNDDEMHGKHESYEEHGVQEYYVLDPDRNNLEAYTRGSHGAALVRRRFADSFTSPRMGIRFDLSGETMRVFYPNGEPFLSFDELNDLQERATARATDAEKDLETERFARQAAETRALRLSRIVELLTKGTLSADEQAELASLQAAP